MRKLNDAIDRFCALHPRLGIPGLMRYVVMINAALFVLGLFAGEGTMGFLALNGYAVVHGEFWRIVTYALLPDGGGIFLLISLLFYYWLGTTMERLWGSTKFTVYYVSGVLLTALGAVLAYFIDGVSVTIYGAVYVNLALFFAYALTFPDETILVMFIIPIKMKWLALLDAVYFAAGVFRSLMAGAYGLALLPLIAMLNLWVFFAPDFGRKANQARYRAAPKTIQFRKAVKEQQRQKGYNHKCAVCGRTDTDYPDLQFRYCSKCAGYHCFCQDHIFDHTHFTE